MEIVELTGLSRSTIWRAMRDGQLGSVKLRKSRLVRHSQLVAFLGFDPLDETELIESYKSRNVRNTRIDVNAPTLFEIEPIE